MKVFSVGDHVIHPLHGAGTITSITIRQNGGKRQKYYALHLLLDDIILYIPVTCSHQVGLRYICSRQKAVQIMEGNFGGLPPQPSSWNCRYRENMERIRSGDICSVTQVVICLRIRNRRRALAGSEKRLLESAEKILYSELMLASGMGREEIYKKLEPQWKRPRRY
ncbi:MAG: CarD family transcriptional regulator [Clostridia bacterium]|nr:CarD family transcriptional regulator [Clostridia bacterium]